VTDCPIDYNKNTVTDQCEKQIIVSSSSNSPPSIDPTINVSNETFTENELKFANSTGNFIG
jgi:hypothetical protein